MASGGVANTHSVFTTGRTLCKIRPSIFIINQWDCTNVTSFHKAEAGTDTSRPSGKEGVYKYNLFRNI